jgi:hypothetical protein
VLSIITFSNEPVALMLNGIVVGIHTTSIGDIPPKPLDEANKPSINIL